MDRQEKPAYEISTDTRDIAIQTVKTAFAEVIPQSPLRLRYPQEVAQIQEFTVLAMSLEPDDAMDRYFNAIDQHEGQIQQRLTNEPDPSDELILLEQQAWRRAIELLETGNPPIPVDQLGPARGTIRDAGMFTRLVLSYAKKSGYKAGDLLAVAIQALRPQEESQAQETSPLGNFQKMNTEGFSTAYEDALTKYFIYGEELDARTRENALAVILARIDTLSGPGEIAHEFVALERMWVRTYSAIVREYPQNLRQLQTRMGPVEQHDNPDAKREAWRRDMVEQWRRAAYTKDNPRYGIDAIKWANQAQARIDAENSQDTAAFNWLTQSQV